MSCFDISGPFCFLLYLWWCSEGLTFWDKRFPDKRDMIAWSRLVSAWGSPCFFGFGGSQFNAYSRLNPYLLLYQILSHMLTCLQSLPSFLRNLDLFPSCHVAPRCSSPPSPELSWCSPAIRPKLFSLSDNIYVD